VSKPYGYIYSITHRESGKVYVGQTVQNVAYRWTQHCRQGFCVLLYRAIQKHGPKAFDVVTLDTAPDKETLDAKEVFWITKLQSTDRQKGYNLMTGGSFGKHSEESRQKMSQKVRAAWERPEIRAKFAARAAPVLSPEARARVTLANTGKRHSEETRSKLSERSQKLWQEKETAEKMRLASIAARSDPDYKEQVAQNTKAQWSDEEMRAKILAAQAAGKAAFWADPVKRAARIAKRAATIARKKAEAAEA
jgi:group I intron endonuclease